MINFLILGGAGQAGKRIANLLLNNNNNNNIILADINQNLCNKICKDLIKVYSADRIKSIFLDASKKDLLIENFKKIDTVIIASSTIKYTENIIEAVLLNDCNLIEIQGPDQSKKKYFEKYKNTFKEKNNFYIIEAGAWPGLPLTMVNYSSKFYDKFLKSEIAGFFNVNWNNFYFSPYTMPEANKFYGENDDIPTILKNGKFFTPNEIQEKFFNFDGINVRCKPTSTTEIQNIKKRFNDIEEFGFYTNFGIKNSDEITTFLCISEGLKNNSRYQTCLKISSKVGYDITAAAVVSAYLSIHSTGLHLMGDLDQIKILNNLKNFNIAVDFTIKEC